MKAPKSEAKEGVVTGFTSSLWSSATSSQPSYGFGSNPSNNNGGGSGITGSSSSSSSSSSGANGEILMQQHPRQFRLDLRPAVLLRNDSEDTATPQSRSESPAFHAADGSGGLSAPHLAFVSSPIATRHRRFFPESGGTILHNSNNNNAVNTSYHSVNSSLGMGGPTMLPTVEEGVEHDGGGMGSGQRSSSTGAGMGNNNRGGRGDQRSNLMDGRDDDDISFHTTSHIPSTPPPPPDHKHPQTHPNPH